MTRRFFAICTASILVGACGGEDARDSSVAAPATTAPAATRGYLPAPAGSQRREVPVAAPPRPAEPLDPASLGPDQPENVQVID